ncbi:MULTISPECIES: hypothetical protein [unclassified Streptomyces]|uniref:phage terminase small subunit n=1 Tax=unclassified Streptomyces TaxID=2593676 RepID=UPI003D90B847
MVRGGPRSRSGPAPSSTGRSHKAKAEQQGWTTLPAAGRAGDAPEFPLVSPSDREYELWEALWSLPQAVAWEAARLEWEVAAYVRILARAEQPQSSSMLWAQVKQVGESLGLTASGMARNRWVIGEAEADDEPAVAAPVAGVASLTDRLKTVGLD